MYTTVKEKRNKRNLFYNNGLMVIILLLYHYTSFWLIVREGGVLYKWTLGGKGKKRREIATGLQMYTEIHHPMSQRWIIK